ncbi:MAG: hypothetical protein E6G17_11815, partial [Actinobacteria bacterium]
AQALVVGLGLGRPRPHAGPADGHRRRHRRPPRHRRPRDASRAETRRPRPTRAACGAARVAGRHLLHRYRGARRPHVRQVLPRRRARL